MSIHTNTLVRCDGEVMTWWTVFAHQGEPPAKACMSWTFADDSTAEDIEGILAAFLILSIAKYFYKKITMNQSIF
jgi:hypothetical protein